MHDIVSITWPSIYGQLLSFVLKRVKDRSTAEDIVHDVFIKVHVKANQLKEADKIIGWIYQITTHTVADYFRKNSRNLEGIALEWDSNNHEFNECVAHCLRVLMNTLPETYRVPLELAEVEGLSQYQIAERLNISYSGARSRVQRARKLLKNKLDELYSIETDSYGNIVSCEDKVPCDCRRKC